MFKYCCFFSAREAVWQTSSGGSRLVPHQAAAPDGSQCWNGNFIILLDFGMRKWNTMLGCLWFNRVPTIELICTKLIYILKVKKTWINIFRLLCILKNNRNEPSRARSGASNILWMQKLRCLDVSKSVTQSSHQKWLRRNFVYLFKKLVGTYFHSTCIMCCHLNFYSGTFRTMATKNYRGTISAPSFRGFQETMRHLPTSLCKFTFLFVHGLLHHAQLIMLLIDGATSN